MVEGDSMDRSNARPTLKYRGVEVIASGDACPAARALQGLRLLTADAPRRLPLQDCDRPATCRCIYRHFVDRRQGPRRENEHAQIPLAHLGPERRHWRGRRDSDYD
jgi:hypothetical protein